MSRRGPETAQISENHGLRRRCITRAHEEGRRSIKFADGDQRDGFSIQRSGVFGSECDGCIPDADGDTVAAATKYVNLNEIDYVCTAGGAMVRYLSGKKLPLIEAMEKAYQRESTRTQT